MMNELEKIDYLDEVGCALDDCNRLINTTRYLTANYSEFAAALSAKLGELELGANRHIAERIAAEPSCGAAKLKRELQQKLSKVQGVIATAKWVEQRAARAQGAIDEMFTHEIITKDDAVEAAKLITELLVITIALQPETEDSAIN
jgi:hypothetical protein